MKRSVLVVSVLVAVLAFGCGFGGTMLGLMVTQPAVPGASQVVQFEVKSGDSANAVADRLQQQGLIRNATIFKLLARSNGLDGKLKLGVYNLTPGMTMNAIMQVLLKGQPDPGIEIIIGPGLRILEYPALFKDLKNFNAANFIQIAKTGKYLDGTAVSSKYWFVPPLHKDAKYALEGYLYPDTYSFNTFDTEDKVINRLLDTFGQHLCPGPDDDPGAYAGVAATCKQHAAKVGADQKSDIFTVAKAKFFETDEVEALYKALTLSSIVIRESSKGDDGTHKDKSQIADILYRRWLVAQGKLAPPPGEVVFNYHCLDADPTVWYAFYDADNPPKKSYWDIAGPPSSTAPQSPYNTYTQCSDLPPGPIAAPYDQFLIAALDPNLGKLTKAFFYLHDACVPPNFYTAVTLGQQQANQNRYLGQCRS